MGDTRNQARTAAGEGGRTLPSRERVIGQGVAWTARWSLRLVAIALGAVLLGLLVKYGWFVIFPVLLALILCTVLAPVSDLLRTRARFPSGLAAAATLLGAIAVVVGVGFAIAPSVSGQSSDLVTSANKGLQQVQDWVQSSSFVSKKQIDAGLQGLQEKLSGSAGSIASGVLTGVSALTNGVVTLVITLILSFLFLKDGRHFLPWVHRMSGARAGAHLEEIGSRAWSTLGGFIRTQALVSLIDAVLIGAGLLLVGVPLAIPLAILTFFAGFIPIVGAFVAGSIAVLVALVSVGPGGALIILAVIVAVQQLEGNVLSPWLQSKSMDLHAAVVLLSVTLGSTLFGITGAFLAVPTAAVAAVVLRYLDDVVQARTEDEVDSPNADRRQDLPGDEHEDASAGPGPDGDGPDATAGQGPGVRDPLAR
ncbi:MAG: pheromone autoinducer 2 transporter [Marmoricola sp.]|nr:pheromone autoinducer 2 transporter [Marmoricola sp.]